MKARGLFEDITRTPEYYPTRSENEILRMQAGAIVQYFPTGAALVEFGSGACIKVRFLLDAAKKLKAYVPVDISGEFLAIEAERLRQHYPNLSILPVVADFMQPFALPEASRGLAEDRFLPRLDDRQFRAARGLRVPASCRRHSGARRCHGCRGRSSERPGRPESGL